MNDSDRPLIIGSGTRHSVSVSEHTGNANSPRNKVHSDAEKKAEKAAINEKAENTGDSSTIVDQIKGKQQKEGLKVNANINENIQATAKDINLNNNKKIDSEALNEISGNGFKNDITKERLHDIHKIPSVDEQNLKIKIESIQENTQAFDAGIDSQNIQEIGIDKNAAPNTVKLNTESALPNKAKLLNDGAENNLQKISNLVHVDAQQPVVVKDTASENLQEIGLDKLENNKQKFAPNVESKKTKAVDVVASTENLQNAPNEKEPVNVQVLPAESKSKADNAILSREPNKNIAQIEGVNDIAKFHTPTEPRGVDNSQPIVKVEREENRQLIDTPHSEPYIQPKVEIKIPEENKQPVAKVGVQDHTERLPTDKTERSYSDISAAPIQTDLPITKVKPSNAQVFKNDEKLAEIKAKVNAINNEMETVNLQLGALGPIKEIPIQSLREKQHEAFLGRVARMKGDVASVNQQLNVLEDMAGLKSKRTG